VTKFCAPQWGGFLEREHQREVPPLKRRLFAGIDLPSVKTIADTNMLLIITSTGDRLFSFIDIDDLEQPWTNDLEQPWTTQKEVLVNFSQFLHVAHISTLNCNEMAGDIPRKPAYGTISIKRWF